MIPSPIQSKHLAVVVVVAMLPTAMTTAALAVDFESDVLPILEDNCWGCHDRDTLDGGVGLDSFYHAMLPTDAGERLFVAGHPEESVLVRVLTATDPDHRMPLDGDPLSDEDIATIQAWIGAGAEWPDDGWRPPVHWSFIPPQRTAPPPVDDAELASRHPNEIDRFVIAKLSEAGLTMNPPAEPARLIRRVSLDLTGLPPTIEQVDAFVADPSFENYVRAVDRMLASKAYGERWATPWLDLARYADSEGYQRDSPRSMWPYRDWVIDALNDDLPFDRFTIEQLAGDLLPNATPSQIVATAFHRNAATNLEAGTDPREDRYKVIVDRVNTTASIWLGLTVGCAQCHNHKYDPISAKEYYELFAFFNSTPMETRQIGSEMGMSGLEHIGPTMSLPRDPIDELRLSSDQRLYQAQIAAIATSVRSAAKATLTRRPALREKVPAEMIEMIESDQSMSVADCQQVIAKVLGGKGGAINVQIAESRVMLDRIKEAREKSVRVMRELDEMQTTFIAKRGDFLSQGAAVAPATPASLHPYDESLPRTRLGLAQWLVDPANPLIARVFVNRLWTELFGQGLVSTADDFGSQGAPPTHPELLDWLAVAFVEDDHWSMKQSLRRIVLSATYRQSIKVRPDAAEMDPRNEWLWRHPGHRFNAEIVRDQLLAISGLLTEHIGGVSVRPYQPPTFWRKAAGAGEEHYLPSVGENAYRRGVYTLWRRNSHYPSFANFDAPDRAACTVVRDRSNTPLQALTLMNDPVYVEMAEAFAKRIANEGGQSVPEKIRWAFRTALARQPTPSEFGRLTVAFEVAAAQEDAPERGWLEIATILLNLHETINRS